MDAETFEELKLGEFFGWKLNPNLETDQERHEEKTEMQQTHFQHENDGHYEPWINEHRDDGNQNGTVKEFKDFKSTVFPGTTRDWALYLPYDFDNLKVRKKKEGIKTFDIIICNDGQEYLDVNGKVKAAQVFDTISYRALNSRKPDDKQILKPIIGIFVNPGKPMESSVDPKTKKKGPSALAHMVPEEERKACTAPLDKTVADLQRSFEYDTVSDRLLDFYLKDIIPQVEKEIGMIILKTDGTLNKEFFPRGCSVIGWDASGMASLLLAFHKPEFFQRVMSTCGNFTGMRGAHNLPYVIRTNKRREVRPGVAVRVLLTSNLHDLISPHGEWLLANEMVESALKYAGYEVGFRVGEGGHTLNHAGSIFGQALLWLYEHPEGEFKDDVHQEEGEEEEEEEDEEEDDD